MFKRNITTLLLVLVTINGWAQKITDSSWRNPETGDWVISLYNDNAVYNNKVWQYDSKTDKKVVLCSGNDKITISIGKEKDGKRQFNIGGKKQMLSAITTSTICDYPMADETPFSTELKDGHASVSGWLRCPKEILKNGIPAGGQPAVDGLHLCDVRASGGRVVAGQRPGGPPGADVVQTGLPGPPR